MNYSYRIIKQSYEKAGYTYFSDTKPFNLNLWGVRKTNGKSDMFDDLLGISCMDEQGNEIYIEHAATTEPGGYYLRDRVPNPKGTFILAPGFYKSCWQIGAHRGKYPALVQVPGYTLFMGWRDNNKNGVVDFEGALFKDVAGLNMHSTSRTSEVLHVGAYSAGCQVRQHFADHELAMQMIERSARSYGHVFSYALFNEDDILI